MVALQDAVVAVRDGQFTQSGSLERIVVTRVVDIVANGCEEQAKNLETAEGGGRGGFMSVG